MKLKKSFIYLLIFTLVLSASLLFTDNISYALLPTSYEEQVSSTNKDWYMDEDYLNINEIKDIVKEWKHDEAFGFDELEQDPLIIAVIDSGINYNHVIFTGDQDPLTGKYPNDVLYRDSLGKLICKNTVTGGDVLDDSKDKHGTHVAGIIAIMIHELDLEKYIKILPIKAGHVESDGTHFSLDDFEEAVDFAISSNASVINMSLTAESSSFGNYIDDNMAKKAIFVGAAGNDSSNSDYKFSKKYYPAAASNVIGVMNYMQYGNEIDLKPTSNRGSAYDLCAPGTVIYSADGSSDINFKALDGTSMASPFVAFGAVLTMLKYKAIEYGTGTKKSVEDIKNIILGSSIKLINDEYKVYDLKSSITDPNDLYTLISVNSGSFNQYYNNVEELDLSVKLLPSYVENNGTFKWYFNNELIGSGQHIKYLPENKLGQFEIKCIWTSFDGTLTSETTKTFEVSYQKINRVTIYDVDIVKIDGYQIVNFDLTGLNSCDPNSFDTILWYVDDVCVGSGKKLTYNFGKEGNYVVNAKINGFLTKSYNIEITSDDVNYEYEKLILKGNQICSIIFSSIFGLIYILILLKVFIKMK